MGAMCDIFHLKTVFFLCCLRKNSISVTFVVNLSPNVTALVNFVHSGSRSRAWTAGEVSAWSHRI